MKSIPQPVKQIEDTRLMELGQNTPLLLVQAVQADLSEKISAWLKDNGVPVEVLRAVELANMLSLYVLYKETGKLSDLEAEEMLANLIEASNLAIKFGGDFMAGDRWIIGESQIPSEWKKAEPVGNSAPSK